MRRHREGDFGGLVVVEAADSGIVHMCLEEAHDRLLERGEPCIGHVDLGRHGRRGGRRLRLGCRGEVQKRFRGAEVARLHSALWGRN